MVFSSKFCPSALEIITDLDNNLVHSNFPVGPWENNHDALPYHTQVRSRYGPSGTEEDGESGDSMAFRHLTLSSTL